MPRLPRIPPPRHRRKPCRSGGKGRSGRGGGPLTLLGFREVGKDSAGLTVFLFKARERVVWSLHFNCSYHIGPSFYRTPPLQNDSPQLHHINLVRGGWTLRYFKKVTKHRRTRLPFVWPTWLKDGDETALRNRNRNSQKQYSFLKSLRIFLNEGFPHLPRTVRVLFSIIVEAGTVRSCVVAR